MVGFCTEDRDLAAPLECSGSCRSGGRTSVSGKTDLFSGPKVPSTYCIYMCVYPNSCTNICFVICLYYYIQLTFEQARLE